MPRSMSSASMCSPVRRTCGPTSWPRRSASVDLVLRLAETAPSPVRYLNLGGGFGIPYFEKDAPLDLTAIGAELALLETKIRVQFAEARVVVELGRYIVGECGVYVTRIVDRKESRGRTFLVVDGGLHHQLAASGNFAGGPAQLSHSDRQPDGRGGGRDGDGRWQALHSAGPSR